jgi:hypothetical protein
MGQRKDEVSDEDSGDSRPSPSKQALWPCHWHLCAERSAVCSGGSGEIFIVHIADMEIIDKDYRDERALTAMYDVVMEDKAAREEEQEPAWQKNDE